MHVTIYFPWALSRRGKGGRTRGQSRSIETLHQLSITPSFASLAASVSSPYLSLYLSIRDLCLTAPNSKSQNAVSQGSDHRFCFDFTPSWLLEEDSRPSPGPPDSLPQHKSRSRLAAVRPLQVHRFILFSHCSLQESC